MRVLIFEPEHDGHRLTYLRFLVPAVTRLVDDVVLTIGAQTPSTEAFRWQLAPLLNSGVTLEPVIPRLPPRPLRHAIGRLSHLRAAVRRHRPDHVFVPYADGLLQVMGLAGGIGAGSQAGTELEGVLHHTTFAYPASRAAERVKRGVYAWAARRSPWSRLHAVDLLSYEWMRRHGPFRADVRMLPDPIDAVAATASPAEARRRLGIPVEGRYVGCVGILDARKGVDRLVRAFAAAGLPETDRLLLVGRVAPEVRALLDEHEDLVRQARIIVNDAYVSDEVLTTALSAMTLVCVGSPHHLGLSNVILRAAGVGRPVLTTTFGWMGAVVPRFGLGWCCEITSPSAFADAIRLRLAEAQSYVPPAAARAMVQFHRPQNFQGALTSRLRERLGRPAAELVTWEQVAAVAAGETRAGSPAVAAAAAAVP